MFFLHNYIFQKLNTDEQKHETRKTRLQIWTIWKDSQEILDLKHTIELRIPFVTYSTSYSKNIRSCDEEYINRASNNIYETSKTLTYTLIYSKDCHTHIWFIIIQWNFAFRIVWRVSIFGNIPASKGIFNLMGCFVVNLGHPIVNYWC